MTYPNSIARYCCAGIDLHKKYSYITVLDPDGNKILQDKFLNDSFVLQKALLQLNVPIRAAVEATFNANWLVNFLSSVGIRTVVVNPLKMKAIGLAGRKTDKIDSNVIAEMNRLNTLPLTYIPTSEEQYWRDISKARYSLVNDRARKKTQLKFILLRNNITSFPYTDIAGKKSQTWLKSLDLKPHEKDMIEVHLNMINAYTESIDHFDKIIREIVDSTPQMKLLMTIPGVGYVIALMLVAEIGNIHRFEEPGQLRGYAGLVPSTYSSGGKTSHGSLTKYGSRFIRYALSEAINHTIKKNEHLEKIYSEKSVEKGKSKAKVMCMSKLLGYIFIMLKRNLKYSELNVAKAEGRTL